MAEQNINTIIKHKTDTSINWQTNNPVLAIGEMGIDSTNNIFKLGNGIDKWSEIEKFYKYWEDNGVNNNIYLSGGLTELEALAQAEELIPGQIYYTSD